MKLRDLWRRELGNVGVALFFSPLCLQNLTYSLMRYVLYILQLISLFYYQIINVFETRVYTYSTVYTYIIQDILILYYCIIYTYAHIKGSPKSKLCP